MTSNPNCCEIATAARAAAERLFITPYAAKDHLTANFGKVNVRSRRELVGRLTGHAPASEIAAVE